MRMTVAMAVACLAVGVTVAAETDASIRKYEINIPRQPLESALKEFAAQTGLQIARFSDATDGGAMVGPVSGSLTPAQALGSLLKEGKLDYQIVNDRTIAIMNSGAAWPQSGSTTEEDLDGSADDSASAPDAALQMRSLRYQFQVAQADTNSTPGSAETGESKEPLEEVIVTAQRRQERLQDVPISINVLSGKELDSSSKVGVTEALLAVPGLSTDVDQYSGGTMLTLRGVSSSQAGGGGGGPIAYYVDSVPFGFARSAVYPDPAAYDLDRIEVLAGPQGTLYGASALNGVVRVLTHDANADEFEFKARTLTSSTQGGGNNYGGDLAVNVPIVEGRLGVRATVGIRDDSGWIDAPLLNTNEINFSKRYNYRVKVHGQATDSLSVDLLAWRTPTDNGAPPFARDDGTIRASYPQHQDSTLDVYGAKLTQKFANFSVSSMTSFLDYDLAGTVDGTVVNAPATIDGLMKAKVFSEEINVVSALDSSWRWSAGAFYRDSREDSYSVLNFTFGGQAVNDDFRDTSKSWAVFGEVGRKLTETLELSAGLRYFHDDQQLTLNKAYASSASGISLVSGEKFDATSERLTPRVVLTWTPSSERMFYASYAQGFRSGFAQAPNIQILSRNFTPAKPDKLTNYEIGAKGSLCGGRFTYEAAVFYMDWQDIQLPLGVNLGVSSTNDRLQGTAVVNGSSASGEGASLALTTRPFGGLELSAGAGWNNLAADADVLNGTDVLYGKDERLSVSPEYTLDGSIAYSWPFLGGYVARVSFAADYTASQQRKQVGTAGVADDLFFTSARLSVDAPKNWSIALFADNLNNNAGASARVIVTDDWAVRHRPRTTGLQLEYRFE